MKPLRMSGARFSVVTRTSDGTFAGGAGSRIVATLHLQGGTLLENSQDWLRGVAVPQKTRRRTPEQFRAKWVHLATRELRENKGWSVRPDSIRAENAPGRTGMRIDRRDLLKRMVLAVIAGATAGLAPSLSHALSEDEAAAHVRSTI